MCSTSFRIHIACIEAHSHLLQMVPIMGAGYHTIHHTVYKHNYGEFAALVCTLVARKLTAFRPLAMHRAWFSTQPCPGLFPPHTALEPRCNFCPAMHRSLLHIHGQALWFACDAGRVCSCHGEARQATGGSLAVWQPSGVVRAG